MSGRIESKDNPHDKIAAEAIRHARSVVPVSGTHTAINEYEDKRVADIHKAIAKMRAAYEKTLSGSFMLEQDYRLFQFETALETISQVGNCGELALFAFDYVLRTYPTVRAEVVQMVNGNHVFVVIGRDPASDINDPSTYGENALICDALEREVYLAKDYRTKLKAYVSAHKFNLIDDKKGEFYIVGLDDPKSPPSTWPISAYVCDKNGQRISSAQEYITQLNKEQKDFEPTTKRRYIVRTPFEEAHMFHAIMDSQSILQQHSKVDTLFESYHLKLDIIIKAVTALLNDFTQIILENMEMKDVTSEKKGIAAPKDDRLNKALEVLIQIQNLTIVKPRESNTQTYRETRKLLQTKLETAYGKASEVPSLLFFSGKTKAETDKIQKAVDKFIEETDKVRPKG